VKHYFQQNTVLVITDIRKQIYVYLSNSFAYPEKELVHEIVYGNYFAELQDLISRLEINVPNKDSFINPFLDIPGEQAADILGIEYTRLFINTPGSSLMVPPYESCYTNKHALVMNKETISDIVKFYEQSGLFFPDESDILPDHIAVEFEFMSYLLEQEYHCGVNNDPEKAREIIKREVNFLQNHLTIWVPELLEKLRDYSNHIFYNNLAGITDIFLAKELDYLHETWGLLENMEV